MAIYRVLPLYPWGPLIISGDFGQGCEYSSPVVLSAEFAKQQRADLPISVGHTPIDRGGIYPLVISDPCTEVLNIQVVGNKKEGRRSHTERHRETQGEDATEQGLRSTESGIYSFRGREPSIICLWQPLES